MPDDEVHLWRVELDQPPLPASRLAQLLADDERSRAARFHFERDRQHFVVGRGMLRIILGGYLRLAPERVQFCYGSGGKPALAEPLNPGQLRFNLAHAQGLALYAISRRRELGVDLEYIQPVAEMEQIAGRFFSAQENTILRRLPAAQQQEAFFNCWTRKEAYLKAIGAGLAQPLDQFDVSLAPGEPARLRRVAGPPRAAAAWSMVALKPAPGFVAALVVAGQGWQLRCWQWANPATGEVVSDGH